MDYTNRLSIPIDGDNKTEFRTSTGLLIAVGYERIVIGGRGPYIEFNDRQILTENLKIPEDQKWRLNSEKGYYIEFRSDDKANVKVYFQRKLVDYADYKIDYLYVSPFELYVDGNLIIEKI